MLEKGIHTEAGPLRIDVGEVLRARAPWLWRLTPRWAVNRLRRLICEEGLNDILAKTYPRRDADFCRGVMEYLDAELTVANPELMPPKEQSRVILVCNHPLGALDGIALIDLWTRHYGRRVRFVVNDLLMAVDPLSGTFLPINKFGHQSREASRALEEALEGDDPVIVFPAGLCSRLNERGEVADLPWHKMFVTKARRYGRPIIPMHFEGHNSPAFYRAARRRKAWHIPFNLEMALLPREVFGCRGARWSLTLRPTIAPENLSGDTAQHLAQHIRDISYGIALQP